MIVFSYPTGKSVYAVVIDTAGHAWNGTAFEPIVDAHWTTYAVALTEQGTASGVYEVAFPAGITTAGTYSIVVYLRVGATPAVTDRAVGQGTMQWSGTAEVPLSSRSTFDPTQLIPFHNQDAVAAPTYNDAFAGAWVEAFGGETEDDVGQSYMKQWADGIPIRTFVLTMDVNGDPVGRS